MPRKKRITILVIAIVLIVLIIFSVLGYLYMKTDLFKSKQTLFAKYLMQNFDMVDILKVENDSEIDEALNNNKYTSQITGKIEYTENMGTSNENKGNKINDVNIKINSNVDKTNNYDYRDVSIESGNEKLLGLEYLNQDEKYGIRLNEIKEFVSIEGDTNKNNQEEAQIYNIQNYTSKIDVNSIFDFTEEEKQQLAKNYIGIIQENISSDKYYKQPNAMITVNNKSIQTNAYSIKLTIEEYNDLYIKILEQIENDEIILSRIDKIENEIKEKYTNYNSKETLREKIINNINKKIEEIQNNNIGKDEVRLTVYEKNKKTIRTSIEKTTEKLTIDLNNDTSVKIDKTKLGDETDDTIIKIEKTKEGSNSNTSIEYEETQDNETVKNIQLKYQQEFDVNELLRKLELTITNDENEGIFTIEDNTQIVQEFDNVITLDKDTIELDKLQQEQKEAIKQILKENFQNQVSNLKSIVSVDDYKVMLGNLGVLAKQTVQLPTNGEVTEIERKRFNSQFEFFVSENLTVDNIKQLIETAKNCFEDMKILTKDGNVEELDSEKLASDNNREYQKNIAEILIGIKQNTNDSEKQEKLIEFLDNNKNDKFTVSVEYNENGLVKIIRAKIQEK